MAIITTDGGALFPETSPILFSIKHFRFLEKCLSSPNGILQKHLVNSLGLDKTTISEVKQDIVKLGWCKEVALGSGKEVIVVPCKVDEIKMFLKGWDYVKQSIPVRPHDICARGIILNKPSHFEVVLERLTKTHHVVISEMENNKRYTIKMDGGKVILKLKGNLIEFWVDGFILPILPKDVPLLEDYVLNGIEQRIFALQSALEEYFGKFRVSISNGIILKSLSTGVLVKSNVSKALGLSQELKELGLFRDSSVYGCDEFEVKGKIDEVFEKIVPALNLIFEKMQQSG